MIVVCVQRRDGAETEMFSLSFMLFSNMQRFLACRHGNMHTCRLQFELRKIKYGLEERGWLCGRHVCFVFTHTQACQTNNTPLPPSSCSNQSCSGTTKPRFLSLARPLGTKRGNYYLVLPLLFYDFL